MCISKSIQKLRSITTLIFVMLSMVLSTYAQQNDNIRLANQYYEQGELQKALSIYQELVKDPENVPFIHENYLELLINGEEIKQAEQYLEKQIREGSNTEKYQLDLAQLYELKGESKKAQALYSELIENAALNSYKTNLLAQLFFSKRMYERALQTYQKAREEQNDESGTFALQIANLYSVLGNKDLMIEEYFRYINQNPRNLEYVKNRLQNVLTEAEDMEAFETTLYEKVQKHPDNLNYSNLLIWVNLQQKNFYGAFVQARAIQKRLKASGADLIEIGIIALDNQDYKTAIKIFEYVATALKNGSDYFIASRYIIKAREELVKNTYPVEKEDIIKLVNDYQNLVDEIGLNNTSLEALNSKALLHAFYLDQEDSAISILSRIIEIPRVAPKLRAQSKLALGDIYLLTGEPWEATLLYSQVEKEHKDEPLGYEAKLKNAKLSYFKGEFALAQGHLDVLKEATTREIANDAMNLSLLIKNNSVLDTSDYVLQQYADAELLLFQNKKEAALDKLDELLHEYKGHSLSDEILILQANILLELGNYTTAVDKLSEIVDSWSHDILADDAFFLRARIYEEYLDDKDRAKEYYREFLSTYPGSLYVAEARKRFRKLRGDFIN
jgi:tetratricopeptide (TPR) repeat protein